MTLAKDENINIPGSLQISPSVFESIAAKVAMECYGVVGMTTPDGVEIVDRFQMFFNSMGAMVEAKPDGLQIDVFVILEYGTNIKAVSQNLSDQIKYEISQFCDVKIGQVRIHVKGVRNGR